jgi:hypothetical protein
MVIRDKTGQRQIISTDPKFARPDTCKLFIYCELQMHPAQRKQVESRSLQPVILAYAHILKVSEKGGVSLYGMGRFPVTLYKEQWVSDT